jgi:hypothetical protein
VEVIEAAQAFCIKVFESSGTFGIAASGVERFVANAPTTWRAAPIKTGETETQRHALWSGEKCRQIRIDVADVVQRIARRSSEGQTVAKPACEFVRWRAPRTPSSSRCVRSPYERYFSGLLSTIERPRPEELLGAIVARAWQGEAASALRCASFQRAASPPDIDDLIPG